ncbi:MAG: hypothetical protein QXQ36_05975 [Sulfolobales archaeon]
MRYMDLEIAAVAVNNKEHGCKDVERVKKANAKILDLFKVLFSRNSI